MRMHKYLKAGSDRLEEAILRIRSVAACTNGTRSNENKTVLFVIIVNDLKLFLGRIGLGCLVLVWLV